MSVCVCFGRLPETSGVGAEAGNVPVNYYAATAPLIKCISPKTVRATREGPPDLQCLAQCLFQDRRQPGKHLRHESDYRRCACNLASG